MYLTALKNLDSRSRRTIFAFALSILVIYAVVISISSSAMYRGRALSNEVHALRMDADAAEPGKTLHRVQRGTEGQVEVKIGTHVDEIDSLSIKDSFWSVSFHVWFAWKGEPKLDPGGHFQIIGGLVSRKELMEEYHGADGTNYQRYRVWARITKYFETARVPLEDHMLNIFIEDGARDGARLRFVADDTSGVGKSVTIPDFLVTGQASTVKAHAYPSSYGDPRVAHDATRVFSRYIAAIQIKRDDFDFYLKIFVGLYAGLLLTLCAFFIRPSDVGPRFALPTGAYFGAVANSYIANGLLPPSGEFGLIDHVAGVGLLTIFISIAASLLSNHLSRTDAKEASRVLDRTMFGVIAVCCVVANVLIPWCAAA